MPVNYEQLRGQLKDAGKALRLRYDAFSRAADRYEAALRTASADEMLRDRVTEALAGKPETRCALPMDEPIDRTHPLPEMPPVRIRMLACDGSQISPSRHDEISFGLINTAVVEYVAHSGETPRISTRTELLPFGDLPSEDQLGMQRDAAEKAALADYALAADRSILTFALCDGPLELFNEMPELKGYHDVREQYLQALEQLAGAKVPAVGYIDRPRSDPVLKMLDLLEESGGKDEKVQGADDSMIFSRLLGPGERSAVFGMNSRLNRELAEEMRLCFFYMNIGRLEHPYISRVEFPAWAADEATLGLLHAALMDQCRQLGGHPYPFILHRAHECAVVTMAEKEEVKGLLLREMALNGLAVPSKSNKQIAKDSSLRT